MLALALSISLLQAPNEPAPAPFEPLVVTHHQIMVHGRRLGYTATVGRLPIRDNETGEAHAGIFFVSYALEPRRPDRPVTFAWNGGPGSNAGLIQMRGLGPRRFTDAGALVDNQETWLDRTDLVFIDPVGTGYSRVTRKEYGAEFYQTRGDAESVAEFIRIYRIRFQRWDAPIYLAGESFGVTRAAGVADVLARRRIPLRGVVLIGLALPLERVPVAVREALRVPSYAAAAWHHQRLGPALQPDFARAVSAATRFALDTLAPALGRPARPAGGEREALIRGMVSYIGTTPTAADTAGVVPGYERFARLLLADRGLRLGHYDDRLTAAMDPADQPYDPNADPSLQGPPLPNGMARYLGDELGYRNDLQYMGPFGGAYPPAPSFRGDWMSVRWRWAPGELTDSATTPAADLPLRRAMAANPALKVLVACGHFDLVCSPAVNDWVVEHIPAALRSRVKALGYQGGHATYLDTEARVRLRADVFGFFEINPLLRRLVR